MTQNLPFQQQRECGTRIAVYHPCSFVPTIHGTLACHRRRSVTEEPTVHWVMTKASSVGKSIFYSWILFSISRSFTYPTILCVLAYLRISKIKTHYGYGTVHPPVCLSVYILVFFSHRTGLTKFGGWIPRTRRSRSLISFQNISFLPGCKYHWFHRPLLISFIPAFSFLFFPATSFFRVRSKHIKSLFLAYVFKIYLNFWKLKREKRVDHCYLYIKAMCDIIQYFAFTPKFPCRISLSISCGMFSGCVQNQLASICATSVQVVMFVPVGLVTVWPMMVALVTVRFRTDRVPVNRSKRFWTLGLIVVKWNESGTCFLTFLFFRTTAMLIWCL